MYGESRVKATAFEKEFKKCMMVMEKATIMQAQNHHE